MSHLETALAELSIPESFLILLRRSVRGLNLGYWIWVEWVRKKRVWIRFPKLLGRRNRTQ